MRGLGWLLVAASIAIVAWAAWQYGVFSALFTTAVMFTGFAVCVVAAGLLATGLVPPGRRWGGSAVGQFLVGVGFLTIGVGYLFEESPSRTLTFAIRVAGWGLFLVGMIVNNRAFRAIERNETSVSARGSSRGDPRG